MPHTDERIKPHRLHPAQWFLLGAVVGMAFIILWMAYTEKNRKPCDTVCHLSQCGCTETCPTERKQ